MDGPSSATPPGWPAEVRPPDAPEWQRTAVAWLLDQCPPEYRGHRVVRGHPVVLARFAVHHVEACLDGCRRAVQGARDDLRDLGRLGVDHTVVEEAVDAWLFEEARLLAVRRAVGLVEDALRGRRYVAHLGGGARGR